MDGPRAQLLLQKKQLARRRFMIGIVMKVVAFESVGIGGYRSRRVVVSSWRMQVVEMATGKVKL